MATARQIVKLLGEIDKLKREKDVVQLVNPAKATYLQCQIFRIFGIIQSCSEDEMEGMASQVLLKRKEVNAEAGDLKMMPIPSLLTPKKLEEWSEKEGQKDKEPFPYWLLPAEVREAVLRYLTSPSDKRSFTKAFPEEADMMGWNGSSLRLELVLPIVFQRNPELGIEETLNLCRARADLQDVVKNCFDTTLGDPFAASDLENFVGAEWKTATRIDPADYVLNPLPFTVVLRYVFDDDDGDLEFERDYADWKLKQLDVLGLCGRNVWSVKIAVRVNLAPSPQVWMIQLIRDCLELLPNLRSLTVDVDVVNASGACEEIQFPGLKYLRQLRLDGVAGGLLHTKLLEKYRTSIKTLRARSFSNIPIISEGETSYPRLTHLDASDDFFYNYGTINKVTSLNALAGTGLKSIRVHGNYKNNNAQHFVSLLTALSRFGETLEFLSVEFAWNKVPGDDDQEKELAKLIDLKFPKVKTLEMRSFPRTWAFLLQFPALEVLSVNTRDSLYQTPSSVAGWTEMDLSFVQEELYTSNVWKLIPFLKTFELVDLHPKKRFQVTRTQSRVYQRKLEEIQKHVGPADIIMSGSKSILQLTNTSLVIEGDVKGNVIQEGNGRILVNGCVRGNIEQKGNGKIFVRGKHDGELVKTRNGVVQVDWGNVKN